eukprot:203384_1
MSQVPLTPLFPTPPQNGYNNDHLPPSFPPNTMSVVYHQHFHQIQCLLQHMDMDMDMLIMDIIIIHINHHGHNHHVHNHHPHSHPHTSHPHSHHQNIQYLSSNSGDTDPTQCPHGNLTAEELINIKIRKRNVCYVVGLPIHVATETKLRTQEWFSQFGNITTIAINLNSKSIQTSSIPAHITYDNDISALNAINFCNKFIFDNGRKLKATFGTQHYCRLFILGNKCTNVFCGFRHSWCKPSDIITQKDINDFKAIPSGAYTCHNIEDQPLGARSVSHNALLHAPNSANILQCESKNENNNDSESKNNDSNMELEVSEDDVTNVIENYVEFEELQIKYESQKHEMVTLKKQVETLNHEIQNHLSICLTLQQDNVNLTKQCQLNNYYKIQYEKQIQRITDLNSLVKSYKQQCMVLQVENNNLKSDHKIKCEKQIQDITNLKNQSLEYAQEIKNYESLCLKFEQQIQNDKQQCNVLQTEIDKLNENKENSNDTMPKNHSHIDLCEQKFEYWLRDIVRLKQYLLIFKQHEYNDITMIEYIDEDVITNELGITNKIHIKLLLRRIE